LGPSPRAIWDGALGMKSLMGVDSLMGVVRLGTPCPVFES
jgi:hypothetical protein